MGVNLYRIDCLTNLHVGSGDVNYNIVDNEVEKDPVTGVPTIHSSGIKGALRVCLEEKVGKKDPKVIKIFGSSHEDSLVQKKSTPGTYKFFNANLMARPLRVSKGNISFINVTTVEIINSFLILLKNLDITEINGYALPESLEPMSFIKDFLVSTDLCAGIEGFEVEKMNNDQKNYELLDVLIGGNFAITTTETMRCFDLPVLARNQLDNGISNNLWYEEVVPHKSIFYFSILTPTDEDYLPFDGLVQIGANASIGYGYTKISKVV